MYTERFYCERAHVPHDLFLATLLLCDCNAICHASLDRQEASLRCKPADDQSTFVKSDKSRFLQVSVRILLDWIAHRLQTEPQILETLLVRGLLGFVTGKRAAKHAWNPSIGGNPISIESLELVINTQ